MKKDDITYLFGVWNTIFWHFLRIFLLSDLNYTAWFDHPGLLNLGHFRPLFFAKWRIFLIQINRHILPPRTAGILVKERVWVVWISEKQLSGRSAILSIFSGFWIGGLDRPTNHLNKRQNTAPLSTAAVSKNPDLTSDRAEITIWPPVKWVQNKPRRHTSLHFFLLQNGPLPPDSRKIWRIYPKISQWNRKNIFINTYCPNIQFDGGVFDLVS